MLNYQPSDDNHLEIPSSILLSLETKNKKNKNASINYININLENK